MTSVALTAYARHMVDLGEACYSFLLLTDRSCAPRRNAKTDGDWRALLEALQGPRPDLGSDGIPVEMAALVSTLDALTRIWTVETLQRSMTGRFTPSVAELTPPGHDLAPVMARALAQVHAAAAWAGATPRGIWAAPDHLPDLLFVEFDEVLLPIRASRVGQQSFTCSDIGGLRLSPDCHLRFASTGASLDLAALLNEAAQGKSPDGLFSKRMAGRHGLDLGRYELPEPT